MLRYYALISLSKKSFCQTQFYYIRIVLFYFCDNETWMHLLILFTVCYHWCWVKCFLAANRWSRASYGVSGLFCVQHGSIDCLDLLQMSKAKIGVSRCWHFKQVVTKITELVFEAIVGTCWFFRSSFFLNSNFNLIHQESVFQSDNYCFMLIRCCLLFLLGLRSNRELFWSYWIIFRASKTFFVFYKSVVKSGII